MRQTHRTPQPHSTHLAANDGREALNLVCLHKVLETPWSEEEGLSLLELHRTGELSLVIVVTKVGNLVQGAVDRWVNTWVRCVCVSGCALNIHVHEVMYSTVTSTHSHVF